MAKKQTERSEHDGDGLDKCDRLWLKLIDQRLRSPSKSDLLRAAEMIEQMRSSWVGEVPEKILRVRIERMRDVIAELVRQSTDVMGDDTVKRLLSLIDGHTGAPTASTSGSAAGPPKRKYAGPIVRPSMPRKRIENLGKIRDADVQRFWDLVRLNDLEVVFDPSVKVDRVEGVIVPAIARVQGDHYFYSRVFPLYAEGVMRRTWDGFERDPKRALAVDLALVLMLTKGRWSHPVHDFGLSRLPRTHPWQAWHDGKKHRRPGWKELLDALLSMDFVYRAGDRTWKLTRDGRKVVKNDLLGQWSPVSEEGDE